MIENIVLAIVRISNSITYIVYDALAQLALLALLGRASQLRALMELFFL